MQNTELAEFLDYSRLFFVPLNPCVLVTHESVILEMSLSFSEVKSLKGQDAMKRTLNEEEKAI
jgi:hypothetical protein